MSRSSLQRVEELFQAAADLPAEERDAFLARECDPELRPRVDAMLSQLGRGETLARPMPPIEALDSPETAGTVIDRYKLLQQIGEGGFGVVYMAEQLEPVVRKVALKIIKVGMDTREVVARFEAERQALALMEHPSIARVLDGGTTATGRPYFVMELVRGVPITDYCDRHNLSTRERLELFIQVCQAVQHAHQKGVIHRDIKPTNVMVTLNDGSPLPKVIDFGVAKAMHGRLTERTLFTAYHQFIGTPAYMSPEQAEMSALDVDTRADIYSLGVLLYELLTGRTPFDGDSLMRAGLAEIQRVLREEQPPRPSLRISTDGDATAANQRRLDVASLSRRLAGDLDWIVMRALEKERVRRYSTASELAADVRRHLDDEPVMAGPPSRLYRARKLLVRHRAAVFTIGLLLLALAAGATATLLARVDAAKQRDAARLEGARAEAVTDFLVKTLALTDPDVAQQREISVRTLLDRAAAEIESGFAGQPRAEARVRATIGRAYESLAADALAEAHLRRAVDLMAGIDDYDGGDHYAALWRLTHVLFRSEKPDAFAFAQRARQVAHDHIRASYPNVAADLDDFIGAIRGGSMGADPEPMARAVELFDIAIARAEREMPADDPLWTTVADSFMDAGFSLWYSPHEPISERFFAEALAIQRRVLPAGHPRLADTLGMLVGVLNRTGQVAEAEARIREALELLRRLYPEDSFQVAFALAMLGVNFADQERFAEAETTLITSHRTLLSIVAEDTFYAIDSFSRVIDLYERWGRPEAAAPYRDELGRIAAGTTWPIGWAFNRFALPPASAELREVLHRLDEICGPYAYSATSGGLDATEAGPLLDRARRLRREQLTVGEPLATSIGRLMLAWSNAFRDGEVRREMTAEALELLRPEQQRLTLEVAEALAYLAYAAREAGDPETAGRLAGEASALLTVDEVGSPWQLANAQTRVARSFFALRFYDEAAALLTTSHRALLTQLGPTSPDFQATRELLAEVAVAWERPELLPQLGSEM